MTGAGLSRAVRREGGFSMVELILALVLFQVGLLAVAGMVFLAQRNLNRAETTLRGLLEAGWMADSLAETGASGSGSLELDWGTLGWAPVSSPVPAIRVWAVAPIGGDTLATALGFPGRGSSPGDSWPDGAGEGGGS